MIAQAKQQQAERDAQGLKEKLDQKKKDEEVRDALKTAEEKKKEEEATKRKEEEAKQKEDKKKIEEELKVSGIKDKFATHYDAVEQQLKVI